MFWINMKGIIDNLPLTLSDTDNPKDVSQNRVIIYLFAMATLIGGFIILTYYRQEALQLVGYWQAWLACFTALVSANVAKKIFKKEGEETK